MFIWQAGVAAIMTVLLLWSLVAIYIDQGCRIGLFDLHVEMVGWYRSSSSLSSTSLAVSCQWASLVLLSGPKLCHVGHGVLVVLLVSPVLSLLYLVYRVLGRGLSLVPTLLLWGSSIQVVALTWVEVHRARMIDWPGWHLP